MANRNISATVQIGAAMSSSVGSVFGGISRKVNDLGASLSKLKRQSADIGRLQSAQSRLTDAQGKGNTAAVARYSAQIEKLSASLQAAGVDTSQLTQEQARLAQSIGRTQQELGRLNRVGDAFAKLKTSAKGVSDAVGGLKEKLGGAFTRLGVAAGVIGGSIAGVGYLTAEFIDQGDALADQAEGLNMSTKALQTWQFAAGTVGIESEKLGSILSKLQSKISEGSDGTKESFAALGVSYSKLKKMKPEQQLTHITEAFARLPDTVNKTALANEIFGKSGYKLLPVLKAGAAGLKEIYDEAKATGYILSDDTNDAVNKADAAFNQFKLRLEGFRNQALAPLLPVFTDLMGQLGQIITQHGPMLTAWIQKAGKSFMENLAPAIGAFVTNQLPALVSNIGQVVTQITSMVSWVAQAVGGWGNLGAGLVALNFAPVIAGVVQLSTSLWTMGAAVGALTGPWGLLAVAIGAAAVAIYSNWDSVSAWFRTNVYIPISEAINDLKELWQGFTDWASNSSVGKLFGSLNDTTQQSLQARDSNVQLSRNGMLPSMSPNIPKSTSPGAELLLPPANMPASGKSGTTMNNNVKQDFNINVTVPPGTDANGIGQAVKSKLQSRDLYDMAAFGVIPQPSSP
jgi:hypothetical protein